MKHIALICGSAALVGMSTMAVADGHEARGRDGEVKIIYWQAPSILNPFLSGGTKDVEAASLVIEPLARYNEKGELVPWLVDSCSDCGQWWRERRSHLHHLEHHTRNHVV
jgi:peptide/nickel transport system substrate-binding protein